MQVLQRLLIVLSIMGMMVIGGQSSRLFGQSFVVYPNHAMTLGDHDVPTQWTEGPAAITLTLETDETILFADGVGQSQRTAQLTETHVSDNDGPQNLDNPNVVGLYGHTLPLLQQNSAHGTSTLSYQFSVAVNQRIDLFLVDVDSGDDVTVRAFDFAGNPVDMLQWTIADEGDLSLIQDTGRKFSTLVAEIPTPVFNTDGIRFSDVSSNYSRSYSILRAPKNSSLGRIDIEFTGRISSPSRSSLGGSSHIYVGLATAAPVIILGDLDSDNVVTFADIAHFIQLLAVGGFQSEADFDRNGVVNFEDVRSFIDVLSDF